MNLEAHTLPTSTGTSGHSGNDKDCACSIQELGWWQGSVISDGDLRVCVTDLPVGFDYWVLATQTCNLYNENFDSIHSAEWIGAKAIAEFDGLRACGSDPRRLHCRASTSAQTVPLEELLLDCDIQARYWISRRFLAKLKPLSMTLRDDAGANEKEKDKFIAWVARSYTRLELSDALNDALRRSKIRDIIEKVLKGHHASIYGVYLEISDEHESSTASVEPPCAVELTFVVYKAADEASVKQTLQAVLMQKVENPKYFAGNNVAKNIERQHVPEKFNIEFTHAVRPTAQWTVDQINACVRYTFNDHLSDSGLSA